MHHFVDINQAEAFWVKFQRFTRKSRSLKEQLRTLISSSTSLGLRQRCNSDVDSLDFLNGAIACTVDQFELTRSKVDQLKELKQKKIMGHNGLSKYLPEKMKIFIDYIASLRSPCTRNELITNISVAAIFSFISFVNDRVRMALMYGVIGNVAMLSILLTRNMPKQRALSPGVDNKKLVSWSMQSFFTALSIVTLSTVFSSLACFLLLSIVPSLEYVLKTKIAISLSVICSAIVASNFEVYEDKNRSGWRWKKAKDGYLPDDVQAQLKSEIDKGEKIEGIYPFSYDPDVEEAEYNSTNALPAKVEMEESELKLLTEYEKWYANRLNSRIPLSRKEGSKEKYFGVKVGLFGGSAPSWLSKAFRKHSTYKTNGKANKDVIPKELEKIIGPLGFRDKSPQWLDGFGNPIWEEKLTVSRKAAREFGTYRKTMWKVDENVILKPYDGASK